MEVQQTQNRKNHKLAKTAYLLQLFRSHVADLNDVAPGAGNIFVCPICLREFTEDDVHSKFLTDGHVWPLGMRKKSKKASSTAVLLCKDCNNGAGGKGDAQMQLYEKIKDIPESGELYGIRTVEIIENPGEKPIRMRANVHKNDKTQVTLSGILNEQRRWMGSSPEDQARFEDLVKRSLETQQQFTVTILPPNEYKQNLVGYGWITSAYLMAFYTLGYRYILHRDFDFIRDYILSSFDSKQKETPTLQGSEDFHIITEGKINFPDPEVRISIPMIGDGKVGLEVCFLRYEISLPILLHPNLFYGFKSYCLRQVSGQSLPPASDGDVPYIYSYIHCTKTVEHTCFFDYLLGKPSPDTQH